MITSPANKPIVPIPNRAAHSWILLKYIEVNWYSGGPIRSPFQHNAVQIEQVLHIDIKISQVLVDFNFK